MRFEPKSNGIRDLKHNHWQYITSSMLVALQTEVFIQIASCQCHKTESSTGRTIVPANLLPPECWQQNRHYICEIFNSGQRSTFYKLLELSHQLFHARSLAKFVLKRPDVLSCFWCWSCYQWCRLGLKTQFCESLSVSKVSILEPLNIAKKWLIRISIKWTFFCMLYLQVRNKRNISEIWKQF